MENKDAYHAYLNEISQYKLLTVDEEVELFLRIQNGDNVARQLFINSNLRLVVKQANVFYIPGVNDLMDLIQEGNIGLLKAIDRYDPTLGYRFSTYAVYLINNEIRRSSARAGLPVEVPPGYVSLVNQMRFVVNNFFELHGCRPTAYEIADQLDCSVNIIDALMPFVVSPFSLQQPVSTSPDDVRELEDFYTDYYNEETSIVEKELIADETKQEFYKLLNEVLTEKERLILRLRWGLNNSQTMSIYDIAEEIGMSPQGVRQAELRAIQKLNKYLLKNHIELNFED